MLSVHGALRFPPGALARWEAAELAVMDEGDPSAGDSIFAQGNDLATVREVLADVGDCYLFVRFIVDGDCLHVRAALGDDFWCAWCGRIFAVVQAAAGLGARGELDVEDDGSYAGSLVVAGPQAVFLPAGPGRREGKQEAARRDMGRIWEEVVTAERARCGIKASVKKASVKKVGVKKVRAK